MLEFEGRQIPNELKEIVDPKRTVLLVWDMQNDQAGGAFNKDALIRNAPPLIAAAGQGTDQDGLHAPDAVSMEGRSAGLDPPRPEGSKSRSPESTQTAPTARQLRLEYYGAIQAGAGRRRDRQAPPDHVHRQRVRNHHEQSSARRRSS